MLTYFKLFWSKFLHIFKQGLSPRDLALSLTIALLISVFPILGIDAIVLTCIALPLRLNLPIMIVVNYAATPLKFLTLIPFIQFGGSVFGVDHTLLTLDSIITSFEEGFFSTLNSLTFKLICGMVGWLVFAVPVAFVTFYILKALFKIFVKTNVEFETNQ